MLKIRSFELFKILDNYYFKGKVLNCSFNLTSLEEEKLN